MEENLARATRDLVDLGERTFRAGLDAAAWSERQVMSLLRSRLDTAAPPRALSVSPSAGATSRSVGDRFRALLERALEQSTTGSRQDFFSKLVDQLVPDEARILGALSDGTTSPVISVYRRTAFNHGGVAVLDNMSLVGKSANLALPELTSTYVNHLMALRLVDVWEEDPNLKTEYEILAADPHVLRALKEAGRGPIPARVEKGTLTLSPLGRQLLETVDHLPQG